MVSFMVTNGGAHPADKWAEMTSNTIVDTLLVDGQPDDTSDEATAARMAKRALRAKLFDIFNDHHDGVQKREKFECGKCKKPHEAAARAIAAIDVTPHMSITDKVFATFAATPFYAHFEKPEVRDTVKAIIAQHTANVIHIERRWHHDKMSKGA